VCTQTLRGILQRILELGLFLMDTHLAFLKLNSLKCNELVAQLEPRSRSHQEVLFVENKKEEKKEKENKHSHLKFTLCSNGVYEHYLCFEVNLSSYHYSWTYVRHLRHLSRSFFSFLFFVYFCCMDSRLQRTSLPDLFSLPFYQVLGTDAGGTQEIVEHNITGLLHPVGRPGSRVLAQNIELLLKNPSVRKQMGIKGRKKVEKMYLKRHMYKKIWEVLYKCMRVK